MIIRSCDIPEFLRRTKEKEVVCFGAGGWLSVLSNEHDYRIEKIFSYVVDNNSALWGTCKNIHGKTLEICSPQRLYETASDKTIILITIGEWVPVYDQLDAIPQLRDTECYVATLVHGYELLRIADCVPAAPQDWRMNAEPQIPKIINYIWFGGNSIPDKFKPYIESWRKHCPDYEIIEWNDNNYDLAEHPYVRQAMEAGYPAFASDYARLDIIYRHGGIYLDVDVELIRNLDELLYNSAFFGFHNILQVASGLGFGASKGHSVIKLLRDVYDDVVFIKPDGSPGFLSCPFHETAELVKLGLRTNGEFQVVENMAVYPADYFNPISAFTRYEHRTPNTYSIHHFAGTWVKDDQTHHRVQLQKEAYENEIRLNGQTDKKV